MFLRTITKNNKKYLALIKTYRDKDNKVRHKLIASLGAMEDIPQIPGLRKVALKLLELSGQEDSTYKDISTLKELKRVKWGPVVVLRRVWDKFQVEQILCKLKSGRRIEFDLFAEVFLMVVEGKELIEEELFNRYHSLFNQEVDVVFYDATTLSFESVTEDKLRAFGYSKEMKVNQTQVLLGLITDQEGMPIGFDVFAGDRFEGHTLKEAVLKLSKRFCVRKVILVADRGMMSRENLEILKGEGYEWVIGERAKNAKSKLRDEIVLGEGYCALGYNEGGEVILKAKVIDEGGGEKVIGVWSKSRAEKDRQERERMVEKAQELIKEKKKIKQRLQHRGAFRYVRMKFEGGMELDEEKIKKEECWDGFYAIRTNVAESDVRRLIEIYHQLWRIEDAFRSLKSHLRVRPIYHYQPNRIKGHLVLCFLAFVLERWLWGELKEKGLNYSEAEIRDILNEMQYSVIEIEGKRYLLRSQLAREQRRLLRALRIKVPPHIQPVEEA